uniref:Large ribosomal subunit protein uL18m n=1 Tax=Phallusia mammillata TaxID=59560 RepID=A0A6F9DKJ2_9ASCI|nr:39S ribosomal protein L18, mitochondrial-like [Phallusia mammillata]
MVFSALNRSKCLKYCAEWSGITTFLRLTASQAQPNELLQVNAQISPLKSFINRNPRNLERLARGHKDLGWGRGAHGKDAANLPTRTYYHRITLRRTKYNTYASLEHYYGNQVVSSSTQEWYVRKQLYSSSDVMACYAVGKLLVEKCLRAGVSCATMTNHKSPKEEARKLFEEAMVGQDFMLDEPQQVSNRYTMPHQTRKGPTPPSVD